MCKDDPGYHPFAWKAVVYLDGEELAECLTADEERGHCIVYAKDADGQVIIDRVHDCLRVTAVYGDVRLDLEKFEPFRDCR